MLVRPQPVSEPLGDRGEAALGEFAQVVDSTAGPLRTTTLAPVLEEVALAPVLEEVVTLSTATSPVALPVAAAVARRVPDRHSCCNHKSRTLRRNTDSHLLSSTPVRPPH